MGSDEDSLRVSSLLRSNAPADQMEGMGILLDGGYGPERFADRLKELSKSNAPGMFGMTVGDIASACLAAGGLVGPASLRPIARDCFESILRGREESGA